MFAFELTALLIHALLIFLEATFSAANLLLTGFRFEHECKNAVFNLSYGGLGMLDLLLESLVLFICFDREHLLPILGDLAFEPPDFPFKFLSGRLVVLCFFLYGGN